MTYLEEITGNDVQINLKPDVEFDKFAEQMLRLDQTTYNKIYDDLSERKKFSSLSTKERLAYFGDDFQEQLKQLHEDFCLQKKTTHSLAAGTYRLHILTGATNTEIAERLEAALGKQFSRSYVSKLFRVGELLTKNPELKIISDTEKLAELSRIPEDKLQQLIETSNDGIVRVSNIDVAKASRSQIQGIVQKELPSKKKTKKPQIPAQIEEIKPEWSLELLKSQLAVGLENIKQGDLVDALKNCIRIIDGEDVSHAKQKTEDIPEKEKEMNWITM